MTTAPGTSLAQRSKTVSDLLAARKDQIQLALPKHMTADKMLRITMTSIARTPKLLECTPASLVSCVMESAQLGLYPDGALGSAYLIPYGDKCTLIVGYRGLIDLARRSGQVESIQARVVHEGDTFEFAYGADPFLIHRPLWPGQGGAPVGVYAIAKLKGGEQVFEVMSREQVEAIRKRSRSGQSGPWVTDYEEMMRKTAIRRLVKYLPMSTELESAVVMEDEQERTGSHAGDFIDVTPEREEKQDELDAIAAAKRGRISEQEIDTFWNRMEATLAKCVEVGDSDEARTVYDKVLSTFDIDKPTRKDMTQAVQQMESYLKMLKDREGEEVAAAKQAQDGDDPQY